MRNHVKLPPQEVVTPTTPLRLAVAAKLGFPDGSMSEAALRRCARSGKLTVERVAGRDYTRLCDIEEMRSQCRVSAKAQGSDFKKPKTGRPSGSSATDSGPSAQAALKANVKRLKESLHNTSSKSTTPKP